MSRLLRRPVGTATPCGADPGNFTRRRAIAARIPGL